ncbi:MAG: glycosyltransferase [Prevotellaceae bacterium]|jgi:glycosyltransferase involved in cell wall biosynthesis|nr:glycosyltransferase [Prevotellaceae bacterium]
MNELSVIIAFRNENIEVERTILEIKRTAGSSVDIILVNDASEDSYDYASIACKYQAAYIENSERQGCAQSREIGIKAAKTPCIFIVDGHMRFYDNSWHEEIVKAIKKNPRAVYCCRCKVWDYEEKEESPKEPNYGAYFKLYDIKTKEVMEVKWISKNIYRDTDEDIVEIPCVLGACYAASKAYWDYLRGLCGLKLYSCDEAYISIKAWMEGGGCRLLKNVAVGHLFRDKFPYAVSEKEFLYNKAFIAETIFPNDIKEEINKKLKLGLGFVDYSRLKRKLNQEEIDDYKKYYSLALTAGFENFQRINNQTIEKLA